MKRGLYYRTQAQMKGKPRINPDSQSDPEVRDASDQDAPHPGGRLWTTLESISDAFLTLDGEWRVTYVNAQAEKLLQKSRRELLGRIIWDQFPEAVGTESDVEYHRAVRENRSVSFTQYYPPLGTWFEAAAYPSEEGLAIHFRDITQRHLDEKRLRLQEAALDAAANGIALTDREGLVLWVNKAYARSYGLSVEDLIGKKPGELIHSGLHDESFYREMWETILAGQVWSGEVVNKRKDGSLIEEELTITPVCDDEENVTHFIAIKQDITERKRLEEHYFRIQRMESIGTLAGGIAHDLNNLLSPIMLGVGLLRQKATDELSQSILDSMGKSVARGTSLVRQVLSFARGVEGAKITLFLDQVVQEVESMVETSFPKNIRILKASAGDLWPILGDPTQLNQVILNLAVNARDAMPDGGTIKVSIRNIEIDQQYAVMNREVMPGRYVVLEVSDDGCGMTREVKERIFEPFFTTKEVGQGTGLGLSTVMGIIRSHDGFINVYSEPGRGTSFKVYFPVQVDPEANEAPELETEALPRGNGELVLIVDDEPTVLNITRHTLESVGYRVLAAEDGSQAVGLFALHRADISLLLTDMVMPAMDGPALIRAVRRLNPDVRIIATSGLHDEANLSRANVVGVSDILEKPYSASRLLNLVHQALNQTK